MDQFWNKHTQRRNPRSQSRPRCTALMQSSGKWRSIPTADQWLPGAKLEGHIILILMTQYMQTRLILLKHTLKNMCSLLYINYPLQNYEKAITTKKHHSQYENLQPPSTAEILDWIGTPANKQNRKPWDLPTVGSHSFTESTQAWEVQHS